MEAERTTRLAETMRQLQISLFTPNGWALTAQKVGLGPSQLVKKLFQEKKITLFRLDLNPLM